MYKNFLHKGMALLLAMLLLFATIPGSVFADDDDVLFVGTATKVTDSGRTDDSKDTASRNDGKEAEPEEPPAENDPVSDTSDKTKVTEAPVEEPEPAEEPGDVAKTTVEPAPVVSEPAEEPAEEPADEPVDEPEDEPAPDLDFSSKRLIVMGDSSIFSEDDPVIASYGSVHLLQFSSEKDARAAYVRFAKKAKLVNVDTAFFTADKAKGETSDGMTKKDNPFTNLKNVKGSGSSYDVAIIDTGAKPMSGVTLVSVLGDDGQDVNGHGSEMVRLVRLQKSDASILSIKAIRNNGEGDASAVYAAIRYAIDARVKVINLSILSGKTVETSIVKKAIEEAVSNGITVICAAGDTGSDAGKYVPASADGAIVVGVCNDVGEYLKGTNHGKAVDYKVDVDNTSAAAATATGIVLAYDVEALDHCYGLIWSTDPEDTSYYSHQVAKDIEEYAAAQKAEKALITRQPSTNPIHTSGDVTVYRNNLSGIDGTFYQFPLLYYTRTPICWPSKFHSLGDGSVLGAYRIGMTTAIPELYFVNGERAYCFDRGTPAKVGTYVHTESDQVLSAILSNIGIPANPSKVAHAARVAKVLSDNNFAVLRAGVNNYVRQEAAIPSSFDFETNGNDVSPSAWKNCIRNCDDMCIALVQMLVWNIVNDGCWLKYLPTGNSYGFGSVSGYISTYATRSIEETGSWTDPKTGEVHTGGWIPATVSIGAFISLEDLDEYAENYLEEHETETEFSRQWEQVIKPGETLELTGNEGKDVWKIFKNDGYYGSNSVLTVTRSNGVTYITASSNATPHQYGWQEYTSISEAIYSSKPYQEGVGGQFIVKEKNILRIRSRIRIEQGGGYLSAKKVSAQPEITNGNSVYSLAGIVFKVYRNQNCTNEVTVDAAGNPFTLVTNAQGQTNAVQLDLGTYWIKETQASVVGTGYCWNPNPVSVTITESNSSASAAVVATIANYPNGDPIILRLRKEDATTTNGAPSGSLSLAGAEYTFWYYPEMNAQGSFTRKWIFATNQNGIILFSSNTPLSGSSEFFLDANGNRMIPAGSIKIKETKAPAGYALDSTERIINFVLYPDGTIHAESGMGTWNSTNQATSLEIISEEQLGVFGSIKISKTDTATGTPGQGDASVEGIRFAIVNDCENAITYNGTSYGPGKVIDILTLNSNGTAATAASSLPYGTYSVYELRADAAIQIGATYAGSLMLGFSEYANNNGYQYEDNHATLNVVEDGVEYTCSFTDPVVMGGGSIAKKDSETNSAIGQGDGSLEGIQYAIINRSTGPVIVNNVEYASGRIVMIATTNANGQFSTSGNILPYGSYDVVELRYGHSALVGAEYTDSLQGNSVYANAHGYLWQAQTKTVTIRLNGQTVSVNFSDPVVRGGVKFGKVDSQSGLFEGQGDATLAGARITVFNNSAHPVIVNGMTYQTGARVMTLTFDENGVCSTDDSVLPYGSYYATELTAPTGYALNSNWRVNFVIREQGVIVDTTSVEGKVTAEEAETTSGWTSVTGGFSNTAKLAEAVVRGGLTITKTDAELNDGSVQGGASLAGVEFAIVNRSSGAVYYNRNNIQPGCIIIIAQLDENGHYATANNALPYGTYEVIELRHNHTATVGAQYTEDLQGSSVYANANGYLYSEFAETVVIRTDNEVIDVECSDPIVRGGVKFYKVDAETGIGEPQGLASLAGAEITIYNNSANAVIVEGAVYEPGKAIATLITDESGFCTTSATLLPFGAYYAVETKAPDGYALNNGWRADFNIREQGVIVDATPSAADKLGDEIIRADLTFYKEDIDGNPMGNIPFLVSLIDAEGNILESHVIVTDANGYVNTAERSKTDDKVNSLDQYVENGVFVNEDMLDSAANIWFGDFDSRSDDKGSLVYGYYVVTELRCSVNAGHDMLTQMLFDLDEDLETVFVDGENFIMKETFVNLIVHPNSDLIDDATGSKTASVGEAVNVTDTFYYDNLKTYRTYKLVTEIMYVSRDGSVTTLLGSNTVTFQPERVDETDIAYGTVSNTVTVNTTGLYGGTLHAVDKLYAIMDGEEVLMLTHNEGMDMESQMLHIPYMITIARDAETGDHVGTVGSEAVVIDHIVYENLDVGHLYEFIGYLKDAETGEVIAGPVTMVLHISENSTDVTEVGGIAFGPSDGEFDMPPFVFDATGLEGRTLVVTEILRDYDNDVILVEHEDLNDESQSIHYINVTTEAADETTGTHTSVVGTTVITDRVTLENTIPGLTYVVNGTLVYQADCVDANGVEHHQGDVIATHEPVTVVAEDTTTIVMISFEVDSSALEGISGVVFEDVTHNDVIVATHYDYEALSQTPQWPKVRTDAVDGTTNSSTGAVAEETTIIDRVTLTNLVIGETYKVRGVLMDKSTGSEFISGGARVTAESDEFEATAAEMTVDLTFTFSSEDLGGRSLVVFEKLYCVSDNGTNEVANHEDINDANQTVDYPAIETNANDGQTGDEVGTVGETETIIDTVTYHNLIVGEEYTITGDLHYIEAFTDMNGNFHEAGDVVMDNNGMPITASVTFVAETAEGSVDLVYTVNSELLRGTSVVVFEDLYYNDVLIGSHADINDENQRVDYPDVSTTAKDDATEAHVGSTGVITVVDVVTLTNLVVGRTYTVNGVLMDKATGEALLDRNGNEITASYGPFEADAPDMTVELTFTVDVEESENLTVVAFEFLVHNDIIVSSHEDIDDEDQTVHIPKIRTTATAVDTEDHVTGANETTVITDVVIYENLVPGLEYTVEGYLVDKSNGGAILIGGEPITASVTFVPEAPDGEIELVFEFDSSALAGTTVVAYETMYYNEVEVAVHADINDDNQTVYIPRVWTNAFDSDTLLDHSFADEEVTVIDVVSYSNLLPGKEYTVRGVLMNKLTGEPLLVNGEEVTAELTFIPETPDGQIEMSFTFDATGVAGTPVVVFERLYYNEIEIAAHADLNDENQTDYIPEISTTAIADDTQEHVTGAHETVTIIDTVYYNGLKPNSKYEISGILMNKATGEPLLDAEGNEITAAVTFVTGDLEEGQTGINGSIDLTFSFDASALAGTTVVAFETMYHEDVVVAAHTDIEDEDQTVYIPEIWTTATEEDTGDHVAMADTEIVVTDMVQYTNLLPGKEYTVRGILMNKATGEPLLVNGEEVTSETSFVPETPDGEIALTFVFDGTGLAGTAVVAFETMYYNEIEVAVHADIEDENQTVYIPAISTSATADDTNDHITQARETITITDVVSYVNLLPGRTYTVSGVLMDKETGEPVIVNSEPVTASAEFVPEEPNGEIELEFVFDGTGLKPKTLVAFETLYLDGIVVAVHEDIDDEDQTVYIPEIWTTAKDITTGSHEGHVDTQVTVEDEVFYENLIPGKTYTVEGVLMVKETGEPLMCNGEPVTASKTFVPEEPNGSVTLTFVFDSTALAGTTVVAFEDLQYEGITIAVHADINDADQSVFFPAITTNAYDKATGRQNMSIGASVVLADRITYTGLTPGKEYVVKGEVMDKSTGRSTGVTAEMRFTPETADGDIIMEFVLNTSVLKGKTLVVFERLYDTEGNLIAEHTDINDAAQTVKVPNTPKTGDENHIVLLVCIMAIALAAAAVTVIVVTRRGKKEKK